MSEALRKKVGSWQLLKFTFEELEAGVTAATALPYVDGGDAADPEMAWDGYIVGMVVNSEAGLDCTLQPTKNGTNDTTNTTTASGANTTDLWEESTWVSFSASDTVGVAIVADTTSRDVAVDLYVLVNVGG